MSDAPTHCPVHGDPDDITRAWACPVATEGDPPEVETCPHFVGMIERALAEFEAGTYTEYYTDDAGQRWRQEYRHHRPVGPPKPRWGVAG